MNNNYHNKRWATDQPGCLIILLTQSPNMGETVGSGLVGGGLTKAEAAAMAVNNVLNELRKRCELDAVVRPRLDVAVLGYGLGGLVHNAVGGPLANKALVSITELAANLIRIKHVMVSEFNINTGSLDQVPMDVPIWVEPAVGDSTPMCAALDVAYQIAHYWIQGHPDSFPPLVVNITDSEATDGNPGPHAKSLKELATTDGNVLLFNCHISSKAGFQVKYPSDISQVPPTDPWAQQLYQMSSVLPQGMIDVGNAMGMTVQPGARGFVFGADIADMANFITIADTPAADPSMR